MIEQIKKIQERVKELEQKLQNSEIVTNQRKLHQFSLEYKDMKAKAELAEKYLSIIKQLAEAQSAKGKSDDEKDVQREKNFVGHFRKIAKVLLCLAEFEDILRGYCEIACIL